MAGAVAFAIVTVDLLVLDPVETVMPDLLRLYRDAGPVSASCLLVAGGWATGAWLLMRLTVDALLPLDALARRGLVVAAFAATLGGLFLSSAIPMFFLSFGQYSVGEDRGYAPAGGTLGTVSSACLWAGVVLISAGALVAVLALMARGLNRQRSSGYVALPASVVLVRHGPSRLLITAVDPACPVGHGHLVLRSGCAK